MNNMTNPATSSKHKVPKMNIKRKKLFSTSRDRMAVIPSNKEDNTDHVCQEKTKMADNTKTKLATINKGVPIARIYPVSQRIWKIIGNGKKSATKYISETKWKMSHIQTM